MKKSILAGIAVMIAAAMTGCKDYADKSADRSNMTFEDSLACYGGELMGTMFRAHIENPNLGVELDKAQILRGIKDVMKTDTANLSYIIGMQMGMSAFQQYKTMAEETDVNRADYVAAIAKALNADSIMDQNQLNTVMSMLQAQLEQMKNQREEEEAYNSKEAVANREAAAELVAKLKDNASYKEGPQGIYYEVVVPGNGTALTNGEDAMVEYTVTNLEGQKVFGNEGHPRKTVIGRAPIELINHVTSVMEMGQTVKAYVPWEAAFGKKGLPRQGVGPCQTVVVTVSVAPAEASK